jgi:hypothetical protein
MTKADKDDIREMFTIGIEHIKEIQSIHWKEFEASLIRIEEQTKKTNGTVLRHSEKIAALDKTLPHTIATCPQNGKIETMYRDMVTTRSIKKMLVTAVIIIGAIIGIVNVVIGLWEKKP